MFTEDFTEFKAVCVKENFEFRTHTNRSAQRLDSIPPNQNK